jgi:hypothetical protein
VPPAQRLEQQSESFMQALPSVRHDEGSGVQVPLQLWLQHWEPPVHVCPFDRHGG